VTSALIDFSCRFQQASVSLPCLNGTDNNPTLGNPGANPVAEFCDAGAAGQAFPVGVDTVLTVRLRDKALNLGPPEQIVVRVLSP